MSQSVDDLTKILSKTSETNAPRTAVRDAVVEHIEARLGRRTDIDLRQTFTHVSRLRSQDEYLPSAVGKNIRPIIEEIINERLGDDQEGDTNARKLMIHLSGGDFIQEQNCYLCTTRINGSYQADHKIPSTIGYLCGLTERNCDRVTTTYRGVTGFNNGNNIVSGRLTLCQTIMAPTHPICNIIKSNDNFLSFARSGEEIVATVNDDAIRNFIVSLKTVIANVGQGFRETRQGIIPFYTAQGHDISRPFLYKRTRFIPSITRDTYQAISNVNDDVLHTHLLNHFIIIKDKFNQAHIPAATVHGNLISLVDGIERLVNKINGRGIRKNKPIKTKKNKKNKTRNKRNQKIKRNQNKGTKRT